MVGKSGGGTAVTEPPAPFADVLREPRAEARLRREKLAEAPGLSPRATSGSQSQVAHGATELLDEGR
jgi:hypothetical protein